MTDPRFEHMIDSPGPALKTGPRRRFLRAGQLIGLGISGLILTGTTVANRRADGATDAMISVYVGGGILLLWLTSWLLIFNRQSFRKRVVLVALIAMAVVGFRLSVREVWFDGDMRPRARFVWNQPSPQDRAQQWLSENAPSTPLSQNGDPAPLQITSADWAEYCGPGRNRIVSEALSTLDWETSPPLELWRRPVGQAWSSCAIADGLLFTQEQRQQQECVVCYDANTGEELWRHEDIARYDTAQGAVGPRATPTVTPEAVFALGATGILNALQPRSGRLLWTTNICADAESDMVEWGMSGSPLIYEDTVIVDAGSASDRGIAAYAMKDGSKVWSSGSHKAGYTSPRLETLLGKTTLLVFHGDGLEALTPNDGTSLWFYPWTNQYKINVAQPMLWNEQIFLSSGYDSGCVLLDPARLKPLAGDASVQTPTEVWPRNRSLKLKFNEAVLFQDHVYGLDDGILACIRAADGKRLWKRGRYKFGHVLLWQDKLLVQAEDGDVAVVEATPDDFRELTRFTALSDRTWNVPVLNRGRLYVRNAAELACFQLPAGVVPTNGAEGKAAE